MFLITGCAHSGTRYIQEVLAKLGRDVGHETLGIDGVVAWQLAVSGPPYRSDYCTTRHGCGPHMDPENMEYFPILHQVRHPLRVITTFQHHEDYPDPTWPLICGHTTCGEREPPLRRAMKYWLEWTALADEQADGLTYRIENLPTRFKWFCEQLDLPYMPEKLAEIPRNTNSHLRGKPALTWANLRAENAELTDEIQEHAKRYGYEVDE